MRELNAVDSVQPMQDRFGHKINYLRISITDRCNERCLYCMPEELTEWLPRSEVLTFAEITRLVRIMTELGVRKIRVTGGEPLVRRNVLELFRELGALPKLTDIGISTNGSLLSKAEASGETVAAALFRLGVRHLNISLDTLDSAQYTSITNRDFLAQTLRGISLAKSVGFQKIRINCVLMRGRNEDQILPLVRFAGENDLLLRFIELMPVSTRDVLNDDTFYPIREAQHQIAAEFGPLEPDIDFRTNGPATYYRLRDRAQRIGFIGAMTNLHFCETCNKVRLTCEGKLRPCLGSHLEFDLKEPLRAGASDEELMRLIQAVVDSKPEQHDFRLNYQPARKMVAIGG